MFLIKKDNYVKKNLKRCQLLLISLVLLTSLVSSQLINTLKVQAAVSLSFTLLGTHPQAAAQTTDTGKTINNLQVFNSKLFAAYGDYQANTGPIDINPFDLSSGTFDGSVLSVPSESLGNWKVINNKLYTTTIDATCSGSCPSGYAVGDNASNWSIHTPFNAEHVFDIESLNGTDLWMFGGSTETAYAWRSTDGGDNWSVAQTNNRNPGSGDDSERYYWGKALDGKMYMQADVYGQGADTQIYDGASWSTGTSENICTNGTSARGPNPMVFDGKIICSDGNRLQSYDGDNYNDEEVTDLYDNYGCDYILDMESSGEFLNVLCNNSSSEKIILRTKNLTSWQTISGLPSTTSSITVDQATNKLYVGTADSKLYASDYVATDTISPSISITSPSNNSTANSLSISVAATDNTEVTKVDYYIDETLIDTSNRSPFDINWINRYGVDGWTTSAGQHTLTAKAFDFEGNVSTSDPITVEIVEPNIILSSQTSPGSLRTMDSTGNLWGLDLSGFFDGSGSPARFVKFNPSSDQATYYPVPEDNPPSILTNNSNLAIASNNSIWYVDCENDTVVNYFYETEVTNLYPIENICTDGLVNLALSSSGSVYIVGFGVSSIHIISALGDSSTIDLEGDHLVGSMATDPNGQIILSIAKPIENTSSLAIVNQAGAIEEYFIPEDNSSISAIAEGRTISMDVLGNTWLVSGGINDDNFNIVKVNASGQATLFALPEGQSSNVVSIHLAGDGTFHALLFNGDIVTINTSDQMNTYRLITPIPYGLFGDDAQTDEINKNFLGYYSGSLVVDTEGNMWVNDIFGDRLLKGLVLGATTDTSNPNIDNGSNPQSHSGGSLADTGQNTRYIIVGSSMLVILSLSLLKRIRVKS